MANPKFQEGYKRVYTVLVTSHFSKIQHVPASEEMTLAKALKQADAEFRNHDVQDVEIRCRIVKA